MGLRKWLLLVAAVLAVAAGGYLLSARAASSTEGESAEAFIRSLLEAQYTRPVLPDARARLKAGYFSLNEEVLRERARILALLENEEKTMAEEMKAEFRGSKVRVRFRTVEAQGEQVYAVVEVLADTDWGYPGARTDTYQTYNLHEMRVARKGGGWVVTMDRNMASTPKLGVTVESLPWGD